MDMAIVIVAFNREKSLDRLLKSISSASYIATDIPLIISIDKSENDRVYKLAEEFQWNFGEKKIIQQENNLGLREHILKCGDLTSKYENIILLEDDLFVAPNFFDFAIQASDFYKNDSNIAGISLYKHHWQVESLREFTPLKTQFDNFFMTYASSWGQVWSKNKWSEFKSWYLQNNANELLFTEDNTPKYLQNWPSTSWLKYHIKFCIDMNKYFVYPYESLTTNFGDQGTHSTFNDPTYQVPLSFERRKKYNFASISDGIKYDSFFENKELYKYLSLAENDLTVDIYGNKKINEQKRYLLTIVEYDYFKVKEFVLALRPVELNIINGIDGVGIKLYDTEIQYKNKKNKNLKGILLKYYYKKVFIKEYINILYYRVLEKIKNR